MHSLGTFLCIIIIVVYTKPSVEGLFSSPDEKYTSLPPNVFAPDGRLHSVEQTAQRASDIRDVSSSLVVSLLCGANEESPGTVVVVSMGPSSPHISYSSSDSIDDDNNTFPSTNFTCQFYGPHDSFDPLVHVSSENQSEQILPLLPISILHSSHLLAATGGSAADSVVLLRRIQQLSTLLYQEHDTILTTTYDPHHLVQLYSSHTLARTCADVIQGPTQTVGGKSGRMLASSAIIVGTDEPNVSSPSQQRQHNIWRLDPTGQFWRVNAVAVGRGAGIVEADLLRLVHNSLTHGDNPLLEYNPNDNQDVDQINVTNEQVQAYLAKLSVEEGLILACRCIVKLWEQNVDGMQKNNEKSNFLHFSSSARSDFDIIERKSHLFLERGLQAVVMGRKSVPEVLGVTTLRKVLRAALGASSFQTQSEAVIHPINNV